MEDNCLLPHDVWKLARKSLVKLSVSDGETHVSRRKVLLNSFHKDEIKFKQFKSSIILLNSMKHHKSKTDCSVLPSVIKLRRQRIIRLPSQDDLWKSIKSNYYYIMDNNLISECQKANKELSLYSPPSSPIPFSQQPISFPEFVERFNALHDRLHQLLVSLQDAAKQYNYVELQSEMDLLGCENMFLSDQAAILQRLDPELKDDVVKRCTILKNKWDVLTKSMWPKKKNETDQTTKSLTADIRALRKWLREVEERLRRMKVTDMSSLEEIRNLYNEEKVLQREIEERGKEINSLVRRCQPATDGAADCENSTRLCRYARHLERSWHHIWIRSLENQCHTEQYLKRHSADLTHNLKDPYDSDEGPLRKHRRLNLDHWTALAATMDRLKMDLSKRTGDILKNTIADQRKRDVGVLCSEKVPVNDKCIMVGTTGIAALKAEYGDDFTNFEIIQDVGYSSESSTHLSSDDTGLESHFNVRIYKYGKDNQPMSLREELESATSMRDFNRLGSSLESSSSAGVSLDDSGLGTGETLTNGDCVDILSQFPVDDDYEPDDLDYLETVLDEVDFGASATSDQEELHFNLSGLESDDSSDNFHNRSSFTTSAQMFYKMISVDSDNGEPEPNDSNNNISFLKSTENSFDSPTTNSNESSNDISCTEDQMNKNTKSLSSDSDPETFKLVQNPANPNEKTGATQRSHPLYCSTPVRSSDKSYKYHNLKRKRDCVNNDTSQTPNRVHSWLSHCSENSVSHQNENSESQASTGPAQSFLTEDVSSCDASCEGTSSSSDEGNVYSSVSSSLCEDDVFRLKPRVKSTNGSIETVVHNRVDSELPILLPPPPSSTESTESFSKNCDSLCCRMKRCSRRMKALSDNDIEKKQSLKKTSNFATHYMLQNRSLSKATTGSRPRLYSSLPTFLRPTSESSTDDYYLSSTLPSYSDTKTSGCTNHSSSSELRRRKRRRSRKKSSSSNRSSTSLLLSSGEHSRNRSRTITSSTSRCGSRRRTMSQRSDFFCQDMPSSDDGKSPLKVDIPPVEENVAFNKLRRPSSGLLSPVESDIVLTQLEEQSTVSDQVWDGYQEMPYLSEGYSEATVDEDAVRKLTEFGDDYGSAIGQPLRLLEPPDDNNNKADCLKSQKKFSKPVVSVSRVSSISDDSDSDSEDLHYVIEESGKALHFARAILKRRQAGESLSSADYAELLATCSTHLRCLETIRSHIDGKEQNFSVCDLKQLHYLIDEWLDLQRNTEMFEKSEDPAGVKFIKAQQNIDALFSKMSQLSCFSDLDTKNLTNWEDVDKKLAKLHTVLTSLQETKEQLLTVNLQVHRFTTEYGEDENFKNCSLKSDVTELYRKWEDAYEQNGANLTELELLKSDWEIYNEKYRHLRQRIKEAELEDDCDNDRLISTTTKSDSIRDEFAELKESSKFLENRLKGGEAWTKIEEDLNDLQQRIYRYHKSPIRTASPSVNHRNPSSRVEEDADDHFEDAIQQLCEKDHSTLSTPQKKEKAATVTPKRNRSRFWRIIKMAVPVQVALVLLYCLACYLEPSCCSSLNNFNFSFTPQLRYFDGRPPV